MCYSLENCTQARRSIFRPYIVEYDRPNSHIGDPRNIALSTVYI